MSEVAEARQLALDEFDERYSGLRLQATEEARQAMIQSLRRYGQLSPVVVWLTGGAWVLIDGFKRLEAARHLPELVTLAARLIEADARTAKAAIYGLNQWNRRIHLLEEAWIVCSLVREERLTQPEAAQLLGHNKSWISRRLALLEKLCASAKEDMALGLLSPSMARQLTRLPAGNQEELLVAIRRDDLSAMEVKQVVDLLLGCATREQIEFVLLKPRQAAREANGGLARGYDPRLSVAGNRISRRLGSLLDGLARMENWLRHSGRAELSQRDGHFLRGGFERLSRDSRSVAELSAALAGELV
ncbi:MAG TPA: ParB N-terminal domain-containing protein [Gemmataceae bacterium]|jgi:ParB-like chromosome segregation protein Spo0J|nr:ParB N-terminal domain-containing protein [Gemmataceae bacterium]